MLTTGFKVGKYELITIVVQAGDTRQEYYFPDLPNLRNAHVQTISVYNEATVTTDPNNIATMTTADVRQSFLVLNINDKEDVKIPMGTLCNLKYQGSPIYNTANQNGYMPFAGQIITWPKSYVKFPNGHDAGQFSIVLGVFYK
jgi:hypothetical protein